MALENIATMAKENIDNQGHTVLYKGNAGTGKTHNILSWPGPIAVAYFDSNLLTLRQAMKSGVDVTPYFCKDWNQFANEFVPAVVNREIDAKTIAIDTIDPLGIKMQQDIQGSRPRLTQADFGTILNRWIDTFGQLIESTKSIGDTPGYNFVAAVHLKDVISGDSGNVTRYAPQIMGAFKDTLEQFFDWVLLCEAASKAKTVGGKSEYYKEFIVRTVPPNPLHTCKGGGLPAVCGGTYSELMSHAGLNSEANSPTVTALS